MMVLQLKTRKMGNKRSISMSIYTGLIVMLACSLVVAGDDFKWKKANKYEVADDNSMRVFQATQPALGLNDKNEYAIFISTPESKRDLSLLQSKVSQQKEIELLQQQEADPNAEETNGSIFDEPNTYAISNPDFEETKPAATPVVTPTAPPETTADQEKENKMISNSNTAQDQSPQNKEQAPIKTTIVQNPAAAENANSDTAAPGTTPTTEPGSATSTEPGTTTTTEPGTATTTQPGSTTATDNGNKGQPGSTTTTGTAAPSGTEAGNANNTPDSTSGGATTANGNGTTAQNGTSNDQDVVVIYEYRPANKTTQKKFDTTVIGAAYPIYETEDMKTNALLLFLCIIAVLLVLKCIHYTCRFKIDEINLRPAFRALFREFVIMAIVFISLEIPHYFHKLDFIHANIEGFLIGTLTFLALWLVCGLIQIFSCILVSINWRFFENLTKDEENLKTLKRQYELKLYRSKNKKVGGEVKDAMIYHCMRQEFILPIYLPVLAESFLRADFDFCQYLTKCLNKTALKLFDIRWGSLFLITVVVVSWRFIELAIHDENMVIVVLCFPLAVTLFLFLLRIHYNRVLYQLVTKVDKPERINFQTDLELKDPLDHYDSIPQPPYLDLDGGFDGASDKQSISSKQVKKRNPSSFLGMRSNRHEDLFMCGSFGVSFTFTLFQTLYVLFLLWGAIFIYKYSWYTMDTIHNYVLSILLITVVFLIMLFNMVLLVPEIIRLYSISTNIQMMKDRSLIEEVITNNKLKNARRSVRIYQIFKLIRRELAEHLRQKMGDNALRDHHRKFLKEAFDQCEDEEVLTAREIKRMIHQCGGQLNKLESFILLKKAKSIGDNVKYSDLSAAIEGITNDTKIDAYLVVKEVLAAYFRVKKSIPYVKLKDFFDEYQTYFEENDAEDFMKEVKVLMGPEDQVRFSDIAALIRDDVEMFPR